jgi:cytochrome bd-type quinol oxidase subunit 2
MTVQIAHLFATLCLGVVFFQIALIAGAPLGAWTQGGRHTGALPWRGRLVAALSVPVQVFMGLAIVSAAGFAGGFWPRWTGWAALGVMAVICGLNWITPSAPERAFWGPVTLIMLGLAGYVMAVGP